MTGFKTCANVEQAEREGALTIYSPDPETNQAKLHSAFMEMFPKIKVTYIRLQTGALYAKLMAERQANVFQPDVLWLSDMTFVLDFQKRNGWARYESPEMAPYRADHKSQPEGFWTWSAVIVAGLAYNPTTIRPADVPKSWSDALDPKWKGVINAKVSNSGLQHLTYEMIKQHVSADYWKKFSELQPRGIDSYVQQFDRTVNGQDQIIHTAQYSGYLQFKAKGAPIAFINPTEGVTAAPYPVGVVDKAPHPEAAKLYLDWVVGIPGQTAFVKATSLYSPRTDVPPPEGGDPITAFKLLSPTDWEGFLKTHRAYVQEWDKITGLR
jgi:iron(III) transport system substrate-binding protein